ncbi:MAG: YCF48-related protein [Saprospiraceae bacterium]
MDISSSAFIYVTLLSCALCLASCRPEGLDTTWQTCPTGSAQDLFHIRFDQSGTGWAAGGQTWYSGIILKSTDGGRNWYTDLTDTKVILDLEEDSTGQLYATGVDGHLWIQPPTGAWSFHRLPEWRINRAVLPVSPDEVVLAGGSIFQLGFVYLADSLDQVSHVTETINLINDLALVEDNHIIAAGYGAVLRSKDHGKHWEFLDITGDNFMAVDMVDLHLGYMVGYGGSILRTEDGWQSWSSIRNGDALSVSNIPFRAVDFLDAQTGVVVGDAGRVWLTRDGGDHWQRLLGVSESIDLTGVCIQGQEIFVAGTGGTILRASLP